MTVRLPAKERRKTILAAAQKLFAKKGFSGMTTAAIAAKVGISEPILYRHFRSKRHLLHVLVERVAANVIVEMSFYADRAENAAMALRVISSGYQELANRYKEDFLVVNRALAEVSDSKTKEILRQHYEDYAKLLSKIIRRGQKEGTLRKDIRPRTAAWHLIHSALGYLYTTPLESADHQSSHYFQSLADLAVDSLLVKRAC